MRGKRGFAAGINPDRLAGVLGGVPKKARHKAPKQGSPLEEALQRQIELARLPLPDREARLVPGRQFRCDFAWPEYRLICEVEGGVWSGGRHTRGHGFNEDCVKYNSLTLLGYRVLRVTEAHINSGKALAWITEGLEAVP